MVYLIIPFAILGYGIGANLYLIFQEKINTLKRERVIGACLFLISVVNILCVWAVIHLNIEINALIDTSQIGSILTLVLAYSLVFLPFIPVGFLIIYIFSINPKISNKLYFSDLLGAGTGALVFVVFINHLAVFRSLLLLSLVIFTLFLYLMLNRKRVWICFLIFLVAAGLLMKISEPQYMIDKDKGWENIPAHFSENQYKTLVSEWHPLGRTDIYQIIDPAIKKRMLKFAFFDLNLLPTPEISYVATNHTAGTPIFKISKEGKEEFDSKVTLFSQIFEAPYLVGDRPNVVVIGTGGGRDIFTAKTHGTQNIIGAEINPSMHKQMSPGGKMYDYSDQIYTKEGVEVFNVDGRHLVKTLPEQSQDLIVLTGVDTFSGLTNGAYTYAESFLYTKNAIEDYMRILNAEGILNFNRRYFPEGPREGLRLFALSLDALKSMGVDHAEDHVVVGGYQTWAILLIKKTPFNKQEQQKLEQYFESQGGEVLFSSRVSDGNLKPFPAYARAFKSNGVQMFEKAYPYDISVITDNDPFFYKYYKFRFLNPFSLEYDRHTGTLIFITQIIVLLQALFFIFLFIFIPLFKFKKSDIHSIPKGGIVPFVSYFSCLGVGFMFIEISLMQKFVLLLGSPIYSIAVTLTALLVFAGVGSYCLKFFPRERMLPEQVTAFLFVWLILITSVGTSVFEYFVGFPFICRVGIVGLALLPLGMVLGMFFPSGLQLIGERHSQSMAWAWGLNSGFSVLGSILAIILAQAFGFNAVLFIAMAIYLVAGHFYKSLEFSLTENKS